jgi:hypothetical protein
VRSAKGHKEARRFDVLSQALACLGTVLDAGWLWMLLLGIGMMIGGMAAWLVAVTSVVLPYDEAFVGMARDQLDAANPRLLAFMAHDRVSLAGTMISIGVLYGQLAWHALRQNQHWAYQTIAFSAAVGFLSFFLPLGHGYFDPLHSLVVLLLLPLFLLGLRGRADAPPGRSGHRAAGGGRRSRGRRRDHGIRSGGLGVPLHDTLGTIRGERAADGSDSA